MTKYEWIPDSWGTPVAGKVVGVVEFKGRVIIAMEYGVYELVDEKLVRIKFEGEGEQA